MARGPLLVAAILNRSSRSLQLRMYRRVVSSHAIATSCGSSLATSLNLPAATSLHRSSMWRLTLGGPWLSMKSAGSKSNKIFRGVTSGGRWMTSAYLSNTRGFRGCVIKGDHQLVEPLVELIELDHPTIALIRDRLNPTYRVTYVGVFPSSRTRNAPVTVVAELCMIREIRAEVPDRSGVHRSASRTERPEVGVAQRDRPEPDVSSLVQPTE